MSVSLTKRTSTITLAKPATRVTLAQTTQATIRLRDLVATA